MPRNELSAEAEDIAVQHALKPYAKYEELPLVSTGCDSYASWMPEFKDLSPLVESDGIVERIMEMLPNNEWGDAHLVITGGEPLLGWQKAYPDLLSHPKMSKLKEITFETNGSMRLTSGFKDFLTEWQRPALGETKWREITFSVSAKLPVSGEPWKDAIKPEVVCSYENYGTVYLKFVITNEEDLKDAERAVEEYRAAGFKGHVYLMPVGGVESVYALNNRNVADMAMRKGWRYSDRLQVPLFKNEWGT
jgi:organic radical activating enzyme